MKIRCLNVNVYRSSRLGDCTNGGVSKYFDQLLVACPTGNVAFDSDREIPLNFCMIERRRLFGDEESVRIVPATINEDGNVVKRPGWWMYGGNLAETSDSRFSEMAGHYYPLKIHDRQE